MASETCCLRASFLRSVFFIRRCLSVFGRWCWTLGQLTSVKPFLLYIFFHTFRNQSSDRPFCADRRADLGGGNLLIHVVQQVQRNAREHEISLSRLPGKWLSRLRSGPQFLRQRTRHVSQRKPRAAGH